MDIGTLVVASSNSGSGAETLVQKEQAITGIAGTE